ncbi:putative ribonuclease H-like domain-containing protein [Tanacetum coccineum]|uniref:Ribonuclease H-like domain-containing protein n=1 Tax=Tanacetum coccineum TaxID=301880 RepID=A0ABQ5D521_9ASTR
MAEQDTPPRTITAMKILIIKKREYDIWSMRMRQYICHTDHNLWDVIINGDLEEESAPTGETSTPPAPKTSKQLAAKRNQERVKSILLLAIPDEYLLKFHNVADAKSLWVAIKARFRGNEESKKMQKNEDINQKFLRSLPPLWNQIALTMRNKPDIDEIYIDDLYNNHRVYVDEMKRSSSSTSTSQNLAFLSFENASSTNEVSTASGDFGVSIAGGISQVLTTLYLEEESTPTGETSDPPTPKTAKQLAAKMIRKNGSLAPFLHNQTTSPQLENEDFQQINEDDLEELDLRWQVAMLTVRCYNCHRKGHFARECRSGRNQGKRSYGDNGRSNAPTNESSSQALVAQDGLGGYDWSNDFEIEPVNYALMAISSSSSSSSSDNEVQKCSKQCLESFKTLQKNYDSEREKHSRARLEIQGYELALESLESRILVHEKNELAWGEKYEFQNYELKCREIKINNLNLELEKVVKERDELKLKIEKWEESSKNLDELLNSLDEYAIRKKIIESKTTNLNTKTSKTVGKTNEANTQKPKTVYESVNRDKVVIEDWNSDDEDDVSEVQIVSLVKTNETQTVKTRVDKIGQTSQKQGIRFKKIKACFVCKSTDHLIKDCNFHDKQSQEPKLKTVVNTGPRVDKSVWDNTKRKRAVHTVSTARPFSIARSVSTVRPFAPKIAQTGGAIRPIYLRMDNVRPRGSYSPIKRSYYTKPAFRPKDLKQDVKTFGVQNMTTAGTRAVVNTGKDSGSFMLKKGNPEILLQDHAVVDSGCSSHMTGNKAYLSDYEDYNGGFVAFGSDPKGANGLGKDFPNPFMAGSLPKTIKQSNDPPLSRGYTLGSGEDSLELMELMANCIQIIYIVRKKNREICTTEKGLQAISATIDGHEKLITEASLRRHLKLEDAEDISSLSNEEIFEHLAHIGITSSPSLSPQPTQPSPLPEPLQPTHEAEETASIPYDSPLHDVYLHGSAEGSMQQHELTVLVNKLNDRIDGLEKDLQQTKKFYSTALTKLVLRVKKLEYKLKSGKARRKAKIEEEVYEKPIDETEVIVKEKTPTEIIEEHGSGEKGEMEISTASPPKDTKVSTAEALVYTRRKAKDKGKAIMVEPATPNKVKKRTQVQLSMHEELARKMEEEERARFNAEQEARALQEEEEERLNLEATWELQK